MIHVPIYEDVTGMSHNDIIERYGEIDGLKVRRGRIFAVVGFIEAESGILWGGRRGW